MGDIDVWLRCPSCRHEWHAATIVPGTWWAVGCTPENTAKQCYCPECNQKPPMQVVTAQQELGL